MPILWHTIDVYLEQGRHLIIIVNRHVLPTPATLECRVHREQALVAGVHRGDDAQVGRQTELAVLDALVVLRQMQLQILPQVVVSLDRILRITILVSIQQLEQVAKYLCAVATIDFLDNQIVRILQIAPRLNVSLRERLRCELITYLLFITVAVCLWLVTAHKLSVVCIWVEGGAHYFRLILFVCFLDCPRLARARGAKEDFLLKRHSIV